MTQRRVPLWLLIGCGLLWITASRANPQDAQKSEVKEVVGHAFTPERRDFNESLMKQLKAPDGFQVSVFAQGLGKPRMMVVAEDGTVYVTRPQQGDVVALKDRDGDGRADEVRTVASNLELVHGIALHQNRLYLASPKKVFMADLPPDGTVGAPKPLIEDLPDGGQHPNRTIAFGPDGMLYISVGSSCNSCKETNKEHATILRARPDGSQRVIFARGLRNTIGFGWHPETGEMWGMNHGSDWRGDDQPPEELNRLVEGADYGWPFCFGDRQADKYRGSGPEGTTPEAYCAKTEPPVLMYQAHSAPIGMVFYTASQFPEEYRGDAFVAMRGSWNRYPPSGYKVVRIHFERGQPRGFEDFLTGFLIEDGRAQFARLAGVTITLDGSLLVSDDSNGVIYRIFYTGTKREARQ